MACKKHTTKAAEPRKDYRGADINRADHNRADKCLEKQDIRILNNNPRNDDM